MENNLIVPVALLGSFGLGICFSLLGSVSVKLMPRLNLDKGKFGTLVSVFMFTCLIASLIVGVSLDKVGYKPITIFGFAATALSIFLIANAKSFSQVVLSSLLLGFGAMALNVTANTLLPQVLFDGKNAAAASNLGNTFFGLGLFLTPMIISSLFRKTSYSGAISVMGAIVIIPLILSVLSSYPQTSTGFVLSDAVGLLSSPVVWVAAILLFCYIGLESTFTNWLPTYGKDVIASSEPGMDSDTADVSAQRLLSMFAIGMMAGRLAASQITAITTSGSWFIAGAALFAVIIIVFMIRTKSINTSRILALLAGLAFAPLFPTIAGVTLSKFPPEIYGSLFGIIFAVGLLGGTIVPKAIGNFAKNTSVQKSLTLLLPVCIILMILALVMGRI